MLLKLFHLTNKQLFPPQKSRKIIPPKAARTTYGGNNNDNNDKSKKNYHKINVAKLNTIFYSEIANISGDELINIIQNKFQVIYKSHIITINNKQFLRLTNEIDPIPDMKYYTKIANFINKNSDPNKVRKQIEDTAIVIENNKIVVDIVL